MYTKNRNYRKKKKTLSDEELVEDQKVSNSIVKDENLEDISETIEELIELRKYRKRPQGIDAEKLSKGETKAKKKKKDDKIVAGDFDELDETGENEKEEDDDDEEVQKKKIMLDSFTKQTNALDVDKHMMAYIEEEMRKRRGKKSDAKNEHEDEGPKPSNPQDELFQAPDHLKVESKPISEGNVQLSTTMLTAIPEVDLGIDVRLKNIEDTEKAKRKLLEQRHQKPKDEKDTFEGSNFSATNRFYRTRPTVSDHERTNNDQPNQNPHKTGQRREMATDDLVAERFKKRLRR